MRKHATSAPSLAEPAVVAAILLAALAMRLVFFRGIQGIDDFNYLRHAAEVWKGAFHLGDVLYWHGMRPLVFVPVSWAFHLLGANEVAAISWPLVASLTTVGLIYALGRILYDRETARYAAGMAAVLPVLVDEATLLVPGAMINLLIAASALFFIFGERRGPRWRLWLLLSGLSFALLPGAGQLGLVFACFFPLAFVFFRRQSPLSYWPFVAAVAAVVAFATGYQWIHTGDAVAYLTVGGRVLTEEVPPLKPFYYLKAMGWPVYGEGGVFFSAALGVVAAVVSKRRPSRFVAAWFVAMWLLIEFGSSSVKEYRPLFKQLRYLSVLGTPATLLAGCGVAWARRSIVRQPLFSRVTMRGYGAVVAVFVLATAASAIGLHKNGAFFAARRVRIRAVAEHVRAARGETVYVTHWLWNTRVGFFMGYEEDYFPSGYDPYHAVRLETADANSKNRYVQTMAPEEKMSPGILLHDERLFELSRGPRQTGLVGEGEIPDVFDPPPETWRLVDRIEIGPNSRVAIYEVPAGRWPGSAAAPATKKASREESGK